MSQKSYRYFLAFAAFIFTVACIAGILAGCPIRVDPPPPSSCLRQPNCGQCASHSTTSEEGSTSRESGRFCVWCPGSSAGPVASGAGAEGAEPGCFPEGHECAGPVRRLEECSDE